MTARASLTARPPLAFGAVEAAHLLRRAGFGGTSREVERAAARGLDATLEELFHADEGDEARHAHDSATRLASLNDPRVLQATWLWKMVVTRGPAREKLALFWHGHFATSFDKVSNAALMWRQYEQFLHHGAGRFRELLGRVARDPAMLLYLDGNMNRKGRPNENFAREVMELFSLGIGHYGEADVQEAARAFSGWHVRNGEFWFNARAHDADPKTVFGVALTGGDEVLDRCAASPDCARFLARKLLRFYVEPSPAAARVDEVAGWWVEEDGEVGAVLRRLFTAPWFFAPEVRRATIKSPAELVVGTLRALEVHGNMKRMAALTADMGQALFAPPSVKGWDGDQAWIQSHTLLARNRFAAAVAFDGEGLERRAPWAELVGTARTPHARTRAILDAVHQGPVSAGTEERLVQFATAHDTEDVESIVRGLVHLLLCAPEFQLH